MPVRTSRACSSILGSISHSSAAGMRGAALYSYIPSNLAFPAISIFWSNGVSQARPHSGQVGVLESGLLFLLSIDMGSSPGTGG